MLHLSRTYRCSASPGKPGCKLSTGPENLLICHFDHPAHCSEEDEKEEEASSSTPANTGEDSNIKADEEAVKESSETESAGQSHL